MKARGATVPLSPGCFEICTKSDLRAEESVRGVEGMGGPDNVGVLFEPVSDAPLASFTENLRSGFFRTVVTRGGDCVVWWVGTIKGSEGADGSDSCKSSSRKGLQKYSA